MLDLPSGTVTFLFTDIEGSTQLLEQIGAAAYAELRADHHRDIRAAVRAHGGVEVDTAGDGFFVAFQTAHAAIGAAADAQKALAGGPVRARMGLHSGAPLVTAEGYAGTEVHRAARIAAAAHGGQILLSSATAELAGDELPGAVSLRNLGEHQLRDLSRPQQLIQLAVEGLPSEFPPVRTLGNRPTNLPWQPTSLVGREHELAAIVERLHDDTRLLTLTGPGGVGKTRLALQAAADALDDFPDGAFLVALEPVTEAALVPAAFAQALGVRGREGLPLEDALREFVRDRELLVVADNFEHLVDAAPLLNLLLGASSGLRFLVTSRARLRLSAEQEFPVEPLPVPASATSETKEIAVRSDAVALFAERARAARPDFELTDPNAAAVTEICMRLDGLPLAIELAAARTRVLSPQALLARLEQRLPILMGGARDLPERQQTLRAAIDWSYRLLAEPEQRFLARLSVFVGGFTLEAAEAVSAPDTLGLDTLDALATLVDNSLVRGAEQGTEEPRFAMLETIREFARDELEASSEAGDFRRRHAEHFLGDPHALLDVGNWAEARSRWGGAFGLEFDNVRAALEWAGETGSRLELPLAVKYQLFPQVLPGEGRLRLKRALEHDIPQEPVLRGRALIAAGALASMQGDLDDAEACLSEGRRLYRDAPNISWGEWRALAGLATAAMNRGDEAAGEKYVDELETFARRTGDDLGLATALALRANFPMLRADYDQARELLRESLALRIKVGEVPFIVFTRLGLAEIAILEGDLDMAVGELQEAHALMEKVRLPHAMWWCVDTTAAVLALGGEMADAVRLYSASERRFEERGHVFRGLPRALRDRTHAGLQQAATDSAYREVRQEGRRMDMEQALEHGIEAVRRLVRT